MIYGCTIRSVVNSAVRYAKSVSSLDEMKIPRIKGERREVRRMLAQQSRRVLQQYREGVKLSAANCVLTNALAKMNPSGGC